MPYEVEQKFRCAELSDVRERLVALGAVAGEAVVHMDCYYKHPVRDFAQTDEAFRLRRVGERNYLTYKGPKVDATTKTRFEEELRLADGAEAAASCDAILAKLGFEPAAVVRKQREPLSIEREGLTTEVALDAVDSVGSFVELEIAVAAKNSSDPAVERAKSVLAALAAELGLVDQERRSYLELQGAHV
jgi:adenylate cyclase class 2